MIAPTEVVYETALTDDVRLLFRCTEVDIRRAKEWRIDTTVGAVCPSRL
jgi:hypothetical protein